MVAGTHSGVGKTTVATGIMAALARSGLAVASAKVGPDFIDPGYHGMATGRPAHNLDSWLCGADAVAPLAASAADGADLLVVEGVMGLFDGASWQPADLASGPFAPGDGSTAEVAAALGAPVLLVVDASAMSTSVAALVHGFTTYRSDVRVAGVVLNRVGGEHHATLLREALAPLADRGVPVLGALRQDDDLTWRDRHLGLVPVVEHPDRVRNSIERIATAVAAGVDLDALVRLARSAPAGPPPGTRTALLPATTRQTPEDRPVRIALAGGKAFSFAYPDNLRRLVEAGAQLVPFDPLVDTALPDDIDGLYAGGGFPEVFAAELAANRPLVGDVGRRVTRGLVTWAECGGALWLAQSLDGHRLCGALDATARMTSRLSLGYRLATARTASPVAAPGATLRGHEFHYSAMDPAGTAFDLVGRSGTGPGGFATATSLASYLHLHLGADPEPAERFVRSAAGRPDPCAPSRGAIRRR